MSEVPLHRERCVGMRDPDVCRLRLETPALRDPGVMRYQIKYPVPYHNFERFEDFYLKAKARIWFGTQPSTRKQHADRPLSKSQCSESINTAAMHAPRQRLCLSIDVLTKGCGQPCGT